MKPSSSSHLVGQHLKITGRSENASVKGINPLYAALSERRGSYRPQPKNTDLYEVKNSDSLAGIAARFNTTPSELVNLNKLSCRTIFPGQIIYVPELSRPSTSDSESKPKRSNDSLNGQHSPKPGHVQRIGSFEEEVEQKADFVAKLSPSQIAEDLNKESLSKFLKIDAKHITDGEGVVSGVLLVTPNHVMFDPNVSDNLVIEHGVEKYGVAAPMHMVVRVALYPDIVRMKVKGTKSSSEEKTMQLYHSKCSIVQKSHSQNEPIDPGKIPSLSLQPEESVLLEEEEKELVADVVSDSLRETITKVSECSLHTQSDNSNAAGSDKFLVESDLTNVSLEQTSFVLPGDSDDNTQQSLQASPENVSEVVHAASEPETRRSSDAESSFENVSLSPLEEQPSKKKSNFEKTKQKFQKGLRKLSITDGLFPNSVNSRRLSLPVSVSFPDLKLKKSEAVNQPSRKKSKSKEKEQKPETSVMSYMNMVEEKPELFASVEKLIPRPAKSFNDNPLYLCLRMGRPKKMSAEMRVSPVMDFGCKLKQEYWFSIPRSRVDNLYWFFLRWAPEKYGDIDDIDLDALGFLSIIESEVEKEDEEEPEPPPNYQHSQRRATWAFPWKRRKSDEISDATKPEEDPRSLSWELVQHENEEKEHLDVEILLPDLLHPSEILEEHHVRKLSEKLPPRAVGYSWNLIYSTAVHGFSLKTLYREMSHHDSPVLLVIASTSGVVFGAMLSCPLRISDHFYGTGESFLFTFYPEFKCFNWSGENLYFMKGNTGSFAIGASDGQFGLWLDDDLFHGCTKQCQTYRNDCLCDQEDFVVRALEAWGFV